MKVSQINDHEIDKSRKTIDITSEIVEEAYIMLSSNLLLSEGLREKFNQLNKSYDQRGVKFTDLDENMFNNVDMAMENDQMLLNISRDDSVPDDFKDLPAAYGTLKRYKPDDDHHCGQPLKKRALNTVFDAEPTNLNSTQVIETHDGIREIDATFSLRPNKPIVKPSESLAPRHGGLKESNPNIRKAFAAPRPVIKPITKVKSTLIGLNREKENKRTPVRRSPRRNSPTGALKGNYSILSIIFINVCLFII